MNTSSDRKGTSPVLSFPDFLSYQTQKEIGAMEVVKSNIIYFRTAVNMMMMSHMNLEKSKTIEGNFVLYIYIKNDNHPIGILNAPEEIAVRVFRDIEGKWVYHTQNTYPRNHSDRYYFD